MNPLNPFNEKNLRAEEQDLYLKAEEAFEKRVSQYENLLIDAIEADAEGLFMAYQGSFDAFLKQALIYVASIKSRTTPSNARIYDAFELYKTFSELVAELGPYLEEESISAARGPIR